MSHAWDDTVLLTLIVWVAMVLILIPIMETWAKWLWLVGFLTYMFVIALGAITAIDVFIVQPDNEALRNALR